MPSRRQESPAAHWCFTVNDIDQEVDYTLLTSAPLDLYDPEVMTYMVYQIEKAPTTGNLHAQGYLCLKTKQRLSGVKKIHATAHWEKAKGTAKQAADYCKKSDSYIAGPWTWGIAPDARGKKSATALAIDAIRAGASMRVIAVEHPEALVRSHRGLQQLSYLLHSSPDWRDVRTTWIWGTTGTGKTRAAFSSKCADGRNPYFVVLPAQWWDGYEGQDTIIFDDFYGQVRLADMLRYLDGYPLQCQVKGAFVWANWTRVFITSNCSPDDVYRSESVPMDAKQAFLRRVTEIIHLE